MKRSNSIGVPAGMAVLAAAAAGQDLVYRFEGKGFADTFGIQSDRAGDLNADGVQDLVACSAVTVRTYSGADGHELHELKYPQIGGFGSLDLAAPVSDLGDVDLDGHDDYLIGLPYNSQFGTNKGTVMVISGADGSTLLQVFGTWPNGQLGHDVDGLGDLDGDGIPDFVAGAPVDYSSGSEGAVYLFTSASGQVVHKLTGANSLNGALVSAAGDLDMDGICDVLYASGNPNKTYVASGADAQILDVVGGIAGAMHPTGDVTGDGFPEFVVGSGYWIGPTGNRGLVHVYSGATIGAGPPPEPIYVFEGTSPDTYLGMSVAGGQDLSGDGIPDILAGAEQCQGDAGFCQVVEPGYARAFSGADGSEIFTVSGSAPGIFDGYGKSVAILGDLNGDGRAEFEVGIPVLNITGPGSGMAAVYSSASLSLLADETDMDLSSGGAQNLVLDAGAANAGRLYAILGSASSIFPGTPIDGQFLPLNLDGYTFVPLSLVNTPPYLGMAGFLDPAGQASASITIPPGLGSSLAGIAFHHAFVALSPEFSVAFASNAVPFHLVK